jgi:Forkhead domain
MCSNENSENSNTELIYQTKSNNNSQRSENTMSPSDANNFETNNNNNNSNLNNNSVSRSRMPPAVLGSDTGLSSSPGENGAFVGSGLNSHGLVPPPVTSTSTGGLLPLDHYRLQLYNYAMVERLRCSQYSGSMGPMCPTYQSVGSYGPRMALSMSLFHNRVFQPEEPKPQHSYIGLIAMAILSNIESKLVLSDIYQHILDNYPYFRSRGPGYVVVVNTMRSVELLISAI